MELVAAMIVGDGDEKKGSRVAIFHPVYTEFGAAVRVRDGRAVVCTIFAQGVV